MEYFSVHMHLSTITTFLHINEIMTYLLDYSDQFSSIIKKNHNFIIIFNMQAIDTSVTHWQQLETPMTCFWCLVKIVKHFIPISINHDRVSPYV